jgi:ribonuclease BN (tRNA processing enzyme)
VRVTVVGCAGSFPGPDSAASCYLVQAAHEGRTFSMLLDLGNGALGALQRHLPPWEVDAVVFSHLHPDHCVDLCGLYVMRRYRPGRADDPEDPVRIPVWGPAGARERMAAINGAEGPEDMGSEFDFGTLADTTPVRIGPFTVTPHRVNHPVEAYGLRVQADGASLAYTGDTDRCPALLPLMTGADLVLADSAFVEGRDHSAGVHLSGRRAAEAALAAGGVERLVLTHLPAWNDPEVCRAQAAAVWPGEVGLARPGTAYELGERRP